MYNYITPKVSMSGPTTFGPLIRKAIEIEKEEGGKQLLFLLIITDGDVSDIDFDKKIVCEASNYPISICVVGVGDGPFKTMIEFDDMPVAKEGDDSPENSKLRKFDNFQFVDFTEFEKTH